MIISPVWDILERLTFFLQTGNDVMIISPLGGAIHTYDNGF